MLRHLFSIPQKEQNIYRNQKMQQMIVSALNFLNMSKMRNFKLSFSLPAKLKLFHFVF